MRRGEVWWGQPPVTGRDKRRPFVIVSADAFNQNDQYPKVMVVHLTTATRAGGPYPWEAAVARGTAGLPRASVGKCGEVYTLRKSDLQALVGTLPRDVLVLFDRALSVALALA